MWFFCHPSVLCNDSSCISLRYLLLLTIVLFVSDTVLKPQIKNKKTVSRPAEKDFKATNVSTYDVLVSAFTATTCLYSRETSCEMGATRYNLVNASLQRERDG